MDHECAVPEKATVRQSEKSVCFGSLEAHVSKFFIGDVEYVVTEAAATAVAMVVAVVVMIL